MKIQIHKPTPQYIIPGHQQKPQLQYQQHQQNYYYNQQQNNYDLLLKIQSCYIYNSK